MQVEESGQVRQLQRREKIEDRKCKGKPATQGKKIQNKVGKNKPMSELSGFPDEINH